MAEAKDKKKGKKPVEDGEGYRCPHCGAQVPMHQDCPTCKLDIDWSKI